MGGANRRALQSIYSCRSIKQRCRAALQVPVEERQRVGVDDAVRPLSLDRPGDTQRGREWREEAVWLILLHKSKSYSQSHQQRARSQPDPSCVLGFAGEPRMYLTSGTGQGPQEHHVQNSERDA